MIAVAGCGGGRARTKVPSKVSTAVPRATTAGDRMLALLPDGAQLVVEVDLARLRANPVVGPLVTKVLGDKGIPQLAGFSDADSVVFAAYGLGSKDAGTVTLFSAKQALQGATPIAKDIYALGATEWIDQVKAREKIDSSTGLQPSKDLLALRERSMPEAAPGASIRVSAKLTFDARIALARITGIENAPGQLSLWADVVDDLAIIIDADATDPGDNAKTSVKRMSATIESALATIAREPTAIALGLPSSLGQAKLVTRGSWVRAIIAIGPRHLGRVVERALVFFEPPKAGS